MFLVMLKKLFKFVIFINLATAPLTLHKHNFTFTFLDTLKQYIKTPNPVKSMELVLFRLKITFLMSSFIRDKKASFNL